MCIFMKDVKLYSYIFYWFYFHKMILEVFLISGRVCVKSALLSHGSAEFISDTTWAFSLQ